MGVDRANEVLLNGLKLIRDLSPHNRDINDVQRIARRVIRDARFAMEPCDAKIELEKPHGS